MKYLISAYSFVFNSIAVASSKIPQNMRLLFVNISIVALNSLGIISHCNEVLKGFLHYYDFELPVAMLSLILLVIGSIDRKVLPKHLTPNRIFWFGWLISFASIIISAFFYPTRDLYFLWGVSSLMVFPLVFIAWSNRGELKKLFVVVAHHMVLASYVFLLINITLTAFVTNSYCNLGGEHEFLGIAPNPNSNGLIVLPFFTSGLYLTIIKQKNKVFYLFSMLFCTMFACISNTRAAELAMILEVVVALILVLRHKGCCRWAWSFRKTAITVIITMSLTMFLSVALMYLDRVDLNAYAAGEMEEATAEVYSQENLWDLNIVFSGRIVLWKAYLKIVDFKGHGNPDGPVFKGYEISKWAHNNALDIWYASGFIAFAGYVIWLLAAWGFVIKCLLKKDEFRKEYLLSALAFIGYFVEAMLEITIYPIQTGVALLCFLTLSPIAFQVPANTLNDNHDKEPVYLDGERHYE